MDPVSHLLFARMVAALRQSRELPRGVVTASVLGGLAPDVDAALMALGWDVYLRWHDAGTHALAGTPVIALITAFVVRTWARSPTFPALWLASWLGVLSHVVFDLYSGASVRLWWPLSEASLSVPVVAMADPLAMVPLAAGALALWVWPRAPRAAGALVVALLVGLGVVKLTSKAWALDAYDAAAGQARPSHRQVEAGWGSWRLWYVFDRLPNGQVRAWVVDGWRGEARLRFAQAGRPDTPLAREAMATFATVRNFVPAHPFAFATERLTDKGAVVFWSDARFCWTPDENADPQEGVPHQDVRPAIGPLRCALWFGGSLDTAGRPREALVWLGGHLQRRSPQRW